MLEYDPRNWFWIVGGNESRYFSSAAKGYVTTLPPDAGVTRIASEAELWEVLAQAYPAGIPDAQLPALDQSNLNAALVAQGSVVRALGLIMFAEINKLRVKNGDPAYTMAQFIAALKAQMRG